MYGHLLLLLVFTSTTYLTSSPNITSSPPTTHLLTESTPTSSPNITSLQARLSSVNLRLANASTPTQLAHLLGVLSSALTVALKAATDRERIVAQLATMESKLGASLRKSEPFAYYKNGNNWILSNAWLRQLGNVKTAFNWLMRRLMLKMEEEERALKEVDAREKDVTRYYILNDDPLVLEGFLEQLSNKMTLNRGIHLPNGVRAVWNATLNWSQVNGRLIWWTLYTSIRFLGVGFILLVVYAFGGYLKKSQTHD